MFLLIAVFHVIAIDACQKTWSIAMKKTLKKTSISIKMYRRVFPGELNVIKSFNCNLICK